MNCSEAQIGRDSFSALPGLSSAGRSVQDVRLPQLGYEAATADAFSAAQVLQNGPRLRGAL